MARPTLTERVEILEQRAGVLETLPARMDAVELQIVQLRTEMRAGFSDVRQEMGARGASLREDMIKEIRNSNEALRTELTTAIRSGDEETRRHMRVLHGEVMSRIATIAEGRRPSRKK